ncbi:MAG: class I SAM-dependent methyltransferase [Thermonemataceae bacterium]|nr:class I SAM-dependent methyltransferase [Thermonemataceae bacterium]
MFIIKTLKKWLSAMILHNRAKFVANQLRKPSGIFAKKVGKKMNESNHFLYDLVLNNFELKHHYRILEIGFGNGYFFRNIFSKANNLKISGIEFSKAMLKEASKRNQKYLRNGKLDLYLGNSNQIPFEDSIFDLIFCVNVVYFWENLEEHFKEIYRVLKPKGKLYIGIRPKEILEKLPFAQYGFHLLETDEWVKVLQENGFTFLSYKIQSEPNMQINKEAFTMKGICMIAEKNQK